MDIHQSQWISMRISPDIHKYSRPSRDAEFPWISRLTVHGYLEACLSPSGARRNSNCEGVIPTNVDGVSCASLCLPRLLHVRSNKNGLCYIQRDLLNLGSTIHIERRVSHTLVQAFKYVEWRIYSSVGSRTCKSLLLLLSNLHSRNQQTCHY